MKKNDRLRLTVSDINNLGYGVARVNDDPAGLVVFLADALPGDLVEAKIIKVTAGYLVARVEALLTPSPLRRPSDCASFPACGGCSYRTLPYEEELRRKSDYVAHCFIKEGLSVSLSPIVSGKRCGYRNKVEYPLSPEGTPGFYARASHRVIPVAGCQLEHPAFRPLLDRLAKFVKKQAISIYNEESGRGLLRHFYLRIGEATGEIMVTLVINGDSLPGGKQLAEALLSLPAGVGGERVVSVYLNHHKEKNNVILGSRYTLLAGKATIDDILCGLRFSLAPASFYQVNRAMAERLYTAAADLASLRPGERLVDLFCGVGTIGLSMIAKAPGSSLLGVEIVPEAVENAKRNAEQNGIENARFVCGDANSEAIGQADVVVVDPPRKGCGQDLLARLAQLSPKRIVYISCSPDTLARDCAILAKFGFAIAHAQPFDLFPGTGHVETLCLLSKLKLKDIYKP